MAARKQSEPGRRKPSKMPSPAKSSSLPRRSPRVRKAPKEGVRSCSPETALGAANLLRKDNRSVKGKRPEKRVVFEEEDADSGESSCYSPELDNRNPTASPSKETHLSSRLDDQPSRSTKSVLSKSRAERMRRLMAADILAGSKQPTDDHLNVMASSSQVGPSKQKNGGVVVHNLVRDLPEDPMMFTLSQLGQHPHDLTMKQISAMFQIVQSRIFGTLESPDSGFSKKHFGFTLTASQVAAWPLHELHTKYLPLYMATRYLADGSEDGWRKFFTQPATRPYLVSAVLGEWFTQRIFKHTAFGFPSHLVNVLEDKDREFLHYDAVVRSKERARLMKGWYEDWQIWPLILEATTAAANNLAEELLTVLRPLLPPLLFDPLDETSWRDNDDQNGIGSGRRDSVELRKERKRQIIRATIKTDLVNLILDCTALHKGIRLTGSNGTIIRAVPNLKKGNRFPLVAATSLECINPRECNEHYPHNLPDHAELLIKMTCWPRFEAVVPAGPDLVELAFQETEYRRELDALHVAGAVLARDDLDRKQDSNDNDDDHDTFSWDDKDHIWPVVPETLQDDEGRNPGVVDPKTGEVNTIKRAAYVTIYPDLCPAKVYCEWADTCTAIVDNTVLGLSQASNRTASRRHCQTLVDAITDARRNHKQSLRLRLEDIRMAAWNQWCLYGDLAQWGFVGLAIAVGTYRSLDLGSFSFINDAVARSATWIEERVTDPLVEHFPGRDVRASFEHIWTSMREAWQKKVGFACGSEGTVTGGSIDMDRRGHLVQQ